MIHEENQNQVGVALGDSRSNLDRDRWLTSDNVADLIGVQRQTLADWRYRGGGPAFFKRGRFIRYRYSDVMAWMGRHLVSSNAEAHQRDLVGRGQ